MTFMGVWGFLAIAAGVIGVVLTVIGRSSAGQQETAIRLKLIEHKLQLIMNQLEIAEPEPPELPRVIAYLELGQKIAAIKAYREVTGVGLAEAKASVEQLARERNLPIR
jgi:hypothetical protein